MNKYAYSTNDEDYSSDQYDTPEEAAREYFDSDGDCLRVFVGEIVKPKLEDHLDARWMLDNVIENSPEEFGGEWAAPWVDGLFDEKEAIADLDEQMRTLVAGWVKKHGLEPTFFNVENVKEYVRDGENGVKLA